MTKTGDIQKMHTTLEGSHAIYHLPIDNDLVAMNGLVGQKILLKFNGEITCSNCGRTIRKSYSQGFCYPCCQDLARCDLCIMKPETCHHHLGTCREPQWGLDNCFAPHIIYLANSSGIKVGITRKSNIPSRWIDQGAVAALPILEVDTRLKSGKIEEALKAFVNDKTNWRKMLKNEVDKVDLVATKNQLLPEVSNMMADLDAIALSNEVVKIHYPVVEYPSKVTSLNLDKTPEISGVLQGIKGQYLLLDTGVFNIRKFSSYNITLTY
ncbi:DUF2797 domain-containing protein [bacterium endosymbiont of Bathymodiolus sp. 5 South]|jgi:hypothetical protein|uniref:DUF2797 domain-containing protein n=1 Tax=bacterium endosymbiont of Bathymodiolus sp. 5 South TaxID=1181670 RepID=UPI0010B3CFF9|nr:DUF2797 domain-containing protein [bacterium endosymbiont of Bathymodiolus sp. 5 South]CAC9653563.1 FIG01199523: hypothetical protein [uncultured Gammaproteobacteria bacterium]CAC9658653.1 FIG01199523: hypothetical protein [uncultured Gammaproteobacteria bacterium]SHN89944.1 FIG01199523: hypothetical protein [bacterium endosymbiont of Bathymodiolus sp. 5 South]SSC08001.1 FIG01199523: hypothetical protein [bacterium endosymbiont of Bathymodiolus sp. 5 South]VVH57394.1 FIG01199523: hypothetic